MSQVVFSSRILIEYVKMTMLWYNNMIWWWYWLSYQRKSVFFFRKNVTVWHAKKYVSGCFSSRILIEYVEMTMSWYNDMIWWWYKLSYQWKSVFFQGKCYSVTYLFLENFFQRYDRSGRLPNMFFVVVGTPPKCILNEFAWAAKFNILILQCHTVTNGIDLRRSPPGIVRLK